MSGSGTQVLANPNTYTSTTTLNGGVLRTWTNADAVQNSTVVVNVDFGLTFGEAGTYNVVDSAGSNNVSLTANDSGPVTLSVGGNNANTTYGGSLGGAGGLAKVGNGILTLNRRQCLFRRHLHHGGHIAIGHATTGGDPCPSAAFGGTVGAAVPTERRSHTRYQRQRQPWRTMSGPGATYVAGPVRPGNQTSSTASMSPVPANPSFDSLTSLDRFRLGRRCQRAIRGSVLVACRDFDVQNGFYEVYDGGHARSAQESQPVGGGYWLAGEERGPVRSR